MKTASVADLKSHLSAYLNASADGPIVITRNGAPVAMLIAVRDPEEIERLLMASSPRLRAILDTSRRQIEGGGGIGHEQFWAEMEKPKAKERLRRATRT
jgi:prevent-host-death family protein